MPFASRYAARDYAGAGGTGTCGGANVQTSMSLLPAPVIDPLKHNCREVNTDKSAAFDDNSVQKIKLMSKRLNCMYDDIKHCRGTLTGRKPFNDSSNDILPVKVLVHAVLSDAYRS